MKLARILPLICLIGAVVLVGQSSKNTFRVPLGLTPMMWPKDNAYSPEKAELGRLLYYDKRVSADNTVACASCHAPEKGFTDNLPVSVGIAGQKGGMSAPTVINRGYGQLQFWDGRAGSLEAQAVGPMANAIEMGHSHEGVVTRLRKMAGYRAMFKQVFGTEEFDLDMIAKAIATFERTVVSGNSPYDQYRAGNKKALTSAQVRGWNVFTTKAKCDACHEGVNFTLNAFHNLGVGSQKATPDEGRFAVTKDPADWGTFKTPTLREIAKTAPYMHDGSLATLEEVVEYYDKGGVKNKNLDERLKPLQLSAAEKKDLVEFMKSLNGEGWQHLTEPKSFPQ